MPYKLKKRVRRSWGNFREVGEVYPDSEFPKPASLLKIGAIEKVDDPVTPKPMADEPTPTDPPAPTKRKRGRPRKKKPDGE